MPFNLKNIRWEAQAAPVSAVNSLFTVLVFNGDFFRTIIANIQGDANGVLIFTSMAMLLFLLNFLVCFLLLRFTGKVGKALISIILLINSGVLYAMRSFGAMIDDRMIGNVLHSTAGEVGSFFSLPLAAYVLVLGVIPVVLLWKVKILRTGAGRTIAIIAGTLALIGAIAAANRKNYLWVDQNVPVFGSQVVPWCYIVNTGRYISIQSRSNEQEIQLPDAEVIDSTKAAVVLVIGESARRANFQLYGYAKPTNPLLSRTEGLRCYKLTAAAANTIDAVRAILTRQDERQLHEILPNYLERNGCDVMWNTSNWGEPPVHISHYARIDELAGRYGASPRYDEVLFSDVASFIRDSRKDKVLAVVHTYTSHGPRYYENYPPRFETFTPVCKSVEVTKSPTEDLVNAYDNTIVYTDWMLATLIGQLQGINGRKCAVIFISDHGESLGEGGRYLHGTGIGSPSDIPQEYEVPFIAWSSDPRQSYREEVRVDPHFTFHSIIDFLGLDSPALDKNKSIFRP